MLEDVFITVFEIFHLYWKSFVARRKESYLIPNTEISAPLLLFRSHDFAPAVDEGDFELVSLETHESNFVNLSVSKRRPRSQSFSYIC